MNTYETIWVQIRKLSGLIWCIKNGGEYGNVPVFCGQGEERSSGLFAACSFARLRGG